MSESAHYLCRNSSLNCIPNEDASVWDLAEKVSLIDVVSGEKPQQNTFFQIIRDDSQAQLFIRFQRETEEICSNFKLHDEPLWKQDVFELFLCDENRLNTYKELQSSPWDVLFDGIISYDNEGKRHLNISWEAQGWKSYSTFNKSEKKLISVWLLPYESLSNCPKPGLSWRFGVFAVGQNSNGQALLSWQKVGIPNFHVPELFGYLDFE